MAESVFTNAIRAQLLDRKFRVNSALAEVREHERLADLLKEIDSALERIDSGTYGICEVCHGGIEENYLRLDPLVRVCFEDLGEEQRKAIERDLELASGIQANLLPKNHARFSSWEVSYIYEPAGSVSGDYCDIIRRTEDGESTLFIVGDVSGKGVAASLIMSQLHAIFRTLVDTMSSIEDIVARANRMLSETTHSTLFVTLVCIEARADGTINVCNAGHPRPLLLKKGTLTSIECASLPLGLSYSGRFESTSLTLEEGDMLLLYTDGLTESYNASDQQYGVDRLQATVQRKGEGSPRSVLDTIVSDLRSFRGTTQKSDDLTVMAIRNVAA